MMVAVRLSVSVIPRLADENLILTYDEHESYCGTDSYTRNPATLCRPCQWTMTRLLPDTSGGVEKV